MGQNKRKQIGIELNKVRNRSKERQETHIDIEAHMFIYILLKLKHKTGSHNVYTKEIKG